MSKVITLEMLYPPKKVEKKDNSWFLSEEQMEWLEQQKVNKMSGTPALKIVSEDWGPPNKYMTINVPAGYKMSMMNVSIS